MRQINLAYMLHDCTRQTSDRIDQILQAKSIVNLQNHSLRPVSSQFHGIDTSDCRHARLHHAKNWSIPINLVFSLPTPSGVSFANAAKVACDRRCAAPLNPITNEAAAAAAVTTVASCLPNSPGAGEEGEGGG